MNRPTTEQERLAILETNMKNIDTKMNGIENSLKELNGKVDAFIRLITDGFVSQATFNEFQNTQRERDKNKLLTNILWGITASVITGLIAFFLRENRI